MGAVEQSTPARPRVYYGWVNVVVAAVAMSATLPGRTYGLGLVKEPLRADLGIGDARFNWLNLWAIVLGAALVPPAGWLIDRAGSRRTLGLVAALLGGCVLLMGRVTTEAELFVTLTLVRGLGQGALSVVAIALVGKWFRRRAGAAMGVFAVLLGVGFAATVPAVGELVRAAGWRAAWAGIGYALLFGLAPLGLLLARSTPESFGVIPDDPIADADGRPVTTRAAARTAAFWVYTLAACVFNLTFSAFTLDIELLLREHGLGDGTANGVILPVLFVSGLSANLAAGGLARRWPLGKLLAGGTAALAAALLAFTAVRDAAGATAFAAALGAAGGVVTVVYFAVYGQTYGRTHLGGIQAAVQVLTVLASAVGPVLLAEVREATGGRTDPFFFLFAGLAVVLAVAAWVVRPPAAGGS